MKAFFLAVLVLVLLGPAPSRAGTDPVARDGSAVYPGFEVNLAGGDGLRRLYVSFEAQCVDEKGAELAVSPRAREAVLLLVRAQTAAGLATPQGKARFKAELVKALNAAIGAPRVVRVLWRQFVIL